MSERICIPDYEYKERIARAAKLVREKGLDVMVVSSTNPTMQMPDISADFGRCSSVPVLRFPQRETLHFWLVPNRQFLQKTSVKLTRFLF